MTNLPQVISLLPKYKDLCKIMKIVIVLQDKIDELEQRLEKLEESKVHDGYNN